VLRPRAERDEVHEEKENWVFVKRKERDNETLKGKFLSHQLKYY